MRKNPYSTVTMDYDESKPTNLYQQKTDIVSVIPIDLHTVLDSAELRLLIKTYHGGKYILKSRYELEHTKEEADYLLTSLLTSGNGLLGKRTIETLIEDTEVLCTNLDILLKDGYGILFCDKFNFTIPEAFIYPLRYLDWSIQRNIINTAMLYNIITFMDANNSDNEHYAGLIELKDLQIELYKNCVLTTLSFDKTRSDINVVKFTNSKILRILAKKYKGQDNVKYNRRTKFQTNNIGEYCFKCPELTLNGNMTGDGFIMRVYNSHYVYDIFKNSDLRIIGNF